MLKQVQQDKYLCFYLHGLQIRAIGFLFQILLDAETRSARQVLIVLFARIANPSYRVATE